MQLFLRLDNLFRVCVRRGAAVAPRTDSACIDMNEGRTRVIADPAAAESKGGIVERQGIDSRDANINRMSLHMLAVLRHTR